MARVLGAVAPGGASNPEQVPGAARTLNSDDKPRSLVLESKWFYEVDKVSTPDNCNLCFDTQLAISRLGKD